MDTCHVISLKRRKDRLNGFLSRLPEPWPLPTVQVFEAVDGVDTEPPRWWRSPPGAWGCYLSHLYVLEKAQRDGTEAAWIFEDDCTFCRNFAKRLEPFLNLAPDDWDMLYIGGEHIRAAEGRPQTINKHVIRPFNANRRHAYAVRRKALPTLIAHLYDFDNLHPKHRGDHHIGILQMKFAINVYAPPQWLCGQAGGLSDIDQKRYQPRFIRVNA